MSELTQMTCEACRVDAPTLTDVEVDEFIEQIPNWQIETRDGIKQLERAYQFKNFVRALAFTNKVGELAESQVHHPALLTEWGNVTVTWWSHKIKGMHKNDFIMSAKTDDIFAASS